MGKQKTEKGSKEAKRFPTQWTDLLLKCKKTHWTQAVSLVFAITIVTLDVYDRFR